MGKISKKYQYGWYGSCESAGDGSCDKLTFDTFEHRSRIESVIRVHEYNPQQDGVLGQQVFEKYTSYNKELFSESLTDATKTFDYYINPTFGELECGVGYLVTTHGEQEDFDILDFQIADGTAFVSSDCAGLIATETPVATCAKDGFNEYVVSSSSAVDDLSNGVTSTFWELNGTLAISSASASAGILPNLVKVYDPAGTLIGAVTFTGAPADNKVFLLVSSAGAYEGKCLSGDIIGDSCNLVV